MLSLRQAIDKTLGRISLAQGVDVQTYAEEPITQMIQHKFDVLFDEIWWPQFRYLGTHTIDPVTGMIIDDISPYIKSYKDIRRVWWGSDESYLPRIPINVNPTRIKVRGLIPVSDSQKVFRVWAADKAETVTVLGRTRPDNFEADEDVIDMDEHLIVLGTAYDYLNGLGTNPAEEEKLLNMFNARLEQLRKTVETEDVLLGSYTSSTNGDWQEIN